MRHNAFLVFVVALTNFALLTQPVFAQDRPGLAAAMEVLSPGVEVQRVDTINWIAVNLESIIGTGDTIRTDDTGRARITFFADGTSTEILPNSEYRILEFSGETESFRLTLELLAGQTLQTLGRILDPASEYQIITPAMTLSARGTAFAVRVQETGRAAMLVSDGVVGAEDSSGTAEVPPAFGIRADVGEGLSPVVRASTFEELDAALDGCGVIVSNADDVSFNVREAPLAEAPIVTTLPTADITRAFGTTESGGWYRVQLDDQLGWIRATTITIEDNCAGLRLYTDDGEEIPPPAASSSRLIPGSV